MRGSIVLVSILAGCSAQSSLGYLQPPPNRETSFGLGSIHERLGAALRAEYKAEKIVPPISLVPADGSELALKRIDATVTIDGPIARTELKLAFHNPENREREGRFTIVLPTSGAVTRFAMKIFGEFREARVVSRERG